MSVRSLAFLVVLGTAAMGPGTGNVPAQESSAPALRGNGPASAEEARLSPAAAEVLKLVRAKLGEEVILAYVQNSAVSFDLTADDVIYLEKQGVPSPVLMAMLNKQAAAPQNQFPSSTDTNASRTLPGSPIYAAPPAPTYYAFDGSWPYWYDSAPYWYRFHYWYDPWPYRNTFTSWWYPFYSPTYFWGHHGHHHHYLRGSRNYYHRDDRRQAAFPYDPNHRHNNTALIQRNYRQQANAFQPALNAGSGSLYSNQRVRSWSQTPGRTPVVPSSPGGVTANSRSLFQPDRSPALGTSSRTATQPVTRDAIGGPRGPSLFGGRSDYAPRAPSAFSAPRAPSAMSAPMAPNAMSAPRAPTAMSAPRAVPAPSGGFKGGVPYTAAGGARSGGGGSLFGAGRR